MDIVMGENHHGLSSQEISMFINVPTSELTSRSQVVYYFYVCLMPRNIHDIMKIRGIFALFLALWKMILFLY